MPITITKGTNKGKRKMGALAINQCRLRFDTARKHSLELKSTSITNNKMLLANEQLNLSQEYNRRLQGKDIMYYANGQYSKVNYSYIMGTGMSTINKLLDDPHNIKSDNSMILTNSGGLVAMTDEYADALKKVLGANCINSKGKGGTFSTDKIPAIIAEVSGNVITEEQIKEVLGGGTVDSEWDGSASIIKTKTGEKTGSESTKDNSDTLTGYIEKLIDFYYPIFQAAAANGWTTEYSNEIERNQDYVSDALISGTLCLQQVQNDGNYKPDSSLSYFTMAGVGGITEKQDSAHREAVTSWYNAEKAVLNQKESYLDISLTQISAELEALNTEMESIKSMIKKDTEIFNWGKA